MASKTRVEVRIHGKDYTIVGVESEEYIHRVALYIDKKMDEVHRSNNKLSTSMIAVLTAINVADDYFKTSEHLNEAEDQVAACQNELDRYEEELNRYKEENEKLKEAIQQLQIELAKKETELEDFINTFDREVKTNMVRMDSKRKIRAK